MSQALPLPMTDQEKEEMLVKQEELTAVKAAAKRDVDARNGLLERLRILEEQNVALRLNLYERVKADVALVDLDEDVSDDDDDVPASLDDASLVSNNEDREVLQHTPPATSTVKARQNAIKSQTEMFLASSNAFGRDRLQRYLVEHKKLVLSIGDLTKEQRVAVKWVFDDYHVRETSHKHLGASAALSLSRPLEDLMKDWSKTMEPASGKVQDALRLNHLTYADAVAEMGHNSSERDGWCLHMGFNEDRQYLYDELSHDENIVWDAPDTDGRRRIRLATLDKLIEGLTDEGRFANLNTRFVFLLTYHSFTTPHEVLVKLRERYHMPLAHNLTPEEMVYFKKEKVERIQIKVCGVLKNWLQEHWDDFESDPSLQGELENFFDDMLSNSDSPLAKSMAKSLRFLMKRQLRSTTLQTTSGGVSKMPKPLISDKVTEENFSLYTTSPLELARQITIIDFDKFKSITARECLNQGWSKKDKHTRAPNIVFMTEQFEKISGWVQSEILSYNEVEDRVKAFRLFLKIATYFTDLNNYNGAFAIFCALNANAIYRLKKTKELLSQRQLERLEELRYLFRQDRNSKHFRKVLRESLTPCIPHLAIFLKDLTFIEDANEDRIGDMINFKKCRLLADRIQWIKQYQQEGYQLQEVPVIQNYFKKALRVVPTETLWEMSHKCEPRE